MEACHLRSSSCMHPDFVDRVVGRGETAQLAVDTLIAGKMAVEVE